MRIDKKKVFCELLNNELPEPQQLISELFKSFDIRVRQLNANVTMGALNNAHGDWYEWLIGIAAWNYCIDNPGSYLTIPLPNVTQFDIATLYREDIKLIIQELRDSVESRASVSLITSNPDFVIINPEKLNFSYDKSNKITHLDISRINIIDNLYSQFIGKCNIEDIIGYASIKTSLRPDRRLQIPHEGSLMKAIYARIQNDKGILNPPGLKYYAISTKVGEADRKALRTVATHSIANVDSQPQAAVDSVHTVNSLAEAIVVFDDILKSNSVF
ncbi:MAG: Cfr10I/Bse634I family restriction endonuclease [Methylacidiphilales bacterium]|nr:Cfr10I/Bse634I family restriction endonuclease [Candidatus Methylacidiphilales bacterium]